MKQIFICGVNRSGTTLLRSLLSGHSQLFVVGYEDLLLQGMMRGETDFLTALKTSSMGKLYRAVQTYTNYPMFKFWALRGELNPHFDFADFDNRFLRRICSPTYDSLQIATIQQLVSAFFESMAEAVNQSDRLYSVSKSCAGADNFARINHHFEQDQPHLLCIYRDPRAVVHSTLSRSQQLLQRARHYIQILAEDWLKHHQAVQLLQNRYPVHIIFYEDLCRDPVTDMQKIATFLNIPYEANLIQPTFGSRDFDGNSSFDDHIVGINVKSIDRWRTTLNPEHQRLVEYYLREVGYEPLYITGGTIVLGQWLRDGWHYSYAAIRSRLPRSRTRVFSMGILLGLLVGIAIMMVLR